MGEHSEELAATCGGSEVNGIGSAQTSHFSSKQEKDGGGCTGTLGGVPSSELNSSGILLGSERALGLAAG